MNAHLHVACTGFVSWLLQIYVVLHVVLIILMCNYGHVLHAVRVHEPLRWVGKVLMGQKSFLTYQSCWFGIGLPEQVHWNFPRIASSWRCNHSNFSYVCIVYMHRKCNYGRYTEDNPSCQHKVHVHTYVVGSAFCWIEMQVCLSMFFPKFEIATCIKDKLAELSCL